VPQVQRQGRGDHGRLRDVPELRLLQVRLSRAAVILFVAAWIGPGTAEAQDSPTEVRAGFELTIAPDGSVERVVPQPALPDVLAKAMVRTISAWQFEPPMWAGKAVRFTHPHVLRLQLVPTTSGGVALRMMGLSGLVDGEYGVHLVPPSYPRAQNIKRIGGRVAYVLRIGTDGALREVRRYWPEDPLDKDQRAFADASQAGLAQFRAVPYLVDGAPVECEYRFVDAFIPPGGESDTSPLPPPPLREACPESKLVTPIEGKLL
jgi:hypothetical protein